ncbi:MAG TPA: hypothetical protein PKH79_04450 [Prolixibacteraceae bacterium]|nr:hypothetical protein [Prolixibacteraceae bacterium]
MIPETNKIEDYILGRLTGKELDDFHMRMNTSKEFYAEVTRNQEIFDSILEQEVMDLRSNLQNIIAGQQNNSEKNPFFDLAQNLNIASTPNSSVSATQNSLQLIHFETHQKCRNERIHQINTKTDQNQERILSNQIHDFILEEEIKDAILEDDIMNLRSNLKEIVSTENFNISDFEIDQYLSNDLSQDRMVEIENLIKNDKNTANQVDLHKEIDFAINEVDISMLRESLSNIIFEEQQINLNEIKRIDNYLMDYLDKKNRSEFEAQLEEDLKLKEETVLQNEINQSILETDIINLRNSLSEIAEEHKESNKVRKLIPEGIQRKPLRYIGVAASAAAIVTVGAFTLTQQKVSSEQLFQQAYLPYDAASLFRSYSPSSPLLKGVDFYNEKKFDDAIAQFDIVLNENGSDPMCNFYTGLCHMEKNDYNDAIHSFQKVILDNDNLFTEQAEWYMALSLLKTNEMNRAYVVLNRIVDNKGYYKKKAKELLSRLK